MKQKFMRLSRAQSEDCFAPESPIRFALIVFPWNTTCVSDGRLWFQTLVSLHFTVKTMVYRGMMVCQGIPYVQSCKGSLRATHSHPRHISTVPPTHTEPTHAFTHWTNTCLIQEFQEFLIKNGEFLKKPYTWPSTQIVKRNMSLVWVSWFPGRSTTLLSVVNPREQDVTFGPVRGAGTNLTGDLDRNQTVWD